VCMENLASLRKDQAMEASSPRHEVYVTDNPPSGTPTVLRLRCRKRGSLRGADYANAMFRSPSGRSAMAFGCVVVAAATAAAVSTVMSAPAL
jgi:hypothetical protein